MDFIVVGFGERRGWISCFLFGETHWNDFHFQGGRSTAWPPEKGGGLFTRGSGYALGQKFFYNNPQKCKSRKLFLKLIHQPGHSECSWAWTPPWTPHPSPLLGGNLSEINCGKAHIRNLLSENISRMFFSGPAFFFARGLVAMST